MTGFANTGFWGIDVKKQKYTGSFYVKGNYNGYFTASLQSKITKEEFASVRVKSHSVSNKWVQHKFTLVPSTVASDVNNTFSITFDASKVDCSLDFNLISLFPPTWNNRPNGLRVDLMQVMKDLDMKFLRFPGGNDLEGKAFGSQWRWNETIGPLVNRPGRASTWGYQETGGLGLIEFMHWCEDLDLEPILAVWGGLYLDSEVIPKASLQPYVEDALNEIEFLSGSVDTVYGALRASLGYPKPWKIKYVEVGNEDDLNSGFDSYVKYRFQAFYDAIKSKFPEITVLSSMTSPNYTLPGDAASDYHQYSIPDQAVASFNLFDNQGSSAHKLLLGEFATIAPNSDKQIVWGQPRPEFPWWIGSVSDAVYLLGAERNADRIIGASYAPLFQSLDSWQWTPNLVSFSADSALTTPSTSWHVLRLFSNNHITKTLPAMSSDEFGPLYYVTGIDDSNSYLFKAAVYNSTGDVPVSIMFEGAGRKASGRLTILSADDPNVFNTPGSPSVVNSTTTKIVAGSGGVFNFSLPNLSVAVLQVKP